MHKGASAHYHAVCGKQLYTYLYLIHNFVHSYLNMNKAREIWRNNSPLQEICYLQKWYRCSNRFLKHFMINKMFFFQKSLKAIYRLHLYPLRIMNFEKHLTLSLIPSFGSPRRE